MFKELRKYQNLTVICGTGVIIFTLWEIAKSFLSVFMGSSSSSTISDIESAQIEPWIEIVIVLFFVFTAVLDIWLRLHVGIRSIRFGRGRSRYSKYLISAYLIAAFTIILVVLNCAVVVSEFSTMDEDTVERTLSYAVIEFTNLANLLELIYASNKVKKLQKMIAETAENEKGEHNAA